MGSRGRNNRGEVLFEFLVKTKKGILDVVYKLMFRNSLREEVLNSSLASGRVGTKIGL